MSYTVCYREPRPDVRHVNKQKFCKTARDAVAFCEEIEAQGCEVARIVKTVTIDRAALIAEQREER